MSTRACIKMKDYDGEWYSYTVGCDGYPKGIIGNIPQGNATYEKIRRHLGAQDYYDIGVEYFYDIDVENRMVSIFEAKYVPEEKTKTSYKAAYVEKGDCIFKGTFEEARIRFCRDK